MLRNTETRQSSSHRSRLQGAFLCLRNIEVQGQFQGPDHGAPNGHWAWIQQASRSASEAEIWGLGPQQRPITSGIGLQLGPPGPGNRVHHEEMELTQPGQQDTLRARLCASEGPILALGQPGTCYRMRSPWAKGPFFRTLAPGTPFPKSTTPHTH